MIYKSVPDTVAGIIHIDANFLGKTQQTQNISITFVQCWTNVEDVGPTLYKCYANVLYLMGTTHEKNISYY